VTKSTAVPAGGSGPQPGPGPSSTRLRSPEGSHREGRLSKTRLGGLRSSFYCCMKFYESRERLGMTKPWSRMKNRMGGATDFAEHLHSATPGMPAQDDPSPALAGKRRRSWAMVLLALTVGVAQRIAVTDGGDGVTNDNAPWGSPTLTCN